MGAEDTLSSFLVTTVHLQQDLELPSRDHYAAQAVSDGLRDAQAANTRRLHASTNCGRTSWHHFCEWTLLTGRQSMPAEPQTVAICSATWPWKTIRLQMMDSFTEQAHRGLNPQGPSPTTPSTPPATLRAMTPRTKRGSNID